MATARTCYVSDEAMLDNWNEFEKWHPERPDRLQRAHELHQTLGLLKRCLVLDSRQATDEELALVHTKEHIEKIKVLETLSPLKIAALYHDIDPTTIISKATNRCARISAGCLLQAVDAVLTNKCLNGVAAIRPPGHHSGPSTVSGFCIFNNIAIAAKYAIQKYNLKRILIFDWDIHHGNGTQEIFYQDNRVLFMSLHRYSMKIFPFSERAHHSYTGDEDGKGYNVNVPWQKGEMGDADYLAAVYQVLLPVAQEFNPELVLVSAGFDAAKDDLLGDCSVTAAGFSQMASLLCTLANGRMVVALEGGYNVEMVAQCLTSVTSVLLGDPCKPVANMKPSLSAVNTINNLRESLKPYWRCLTPEETPLVVEPETDIEKMEVHKPTCPHVKDLKNPPDDLDSDIVKNGAAICLHCFRIFQSDKDSKDVREHAASSLHPLSMRLDNYFVFCQLCRHHVTNKAFLPIKSKVFQLQGGQL